MLANIGSNAAALNEIGLQITRIEGRRRRYPRPRPRTPLPEGQGAETRWSSFAATRSTIIWRTAVDRLDDVADEIQGIVIEHV